MAETKFNLGQIKKIVLLVKSLHPINSAPSNSETKVTLMSGSCHLDGALNVKIGVECQIFVIVIFFKCGWVLQFGAHLRYHNGALTQKR